MSRQATPAADLLTTSDDARFAARTTDTYRKAKAAGLSRAAAACVRIAQKRGMFITTTGECVQGLPAAEYVRVLTVAPSTRTDTKGAVDATILVRVGTMVLEAEVTLCPEPGRPTRRRRHPLGVWGDMDMWASDNLVSAIRDAEAERDAAIEADSDDPIVDFNVSDLASEIEHAVDEAAEEAGL